MYTVSTNFLNEIKEPSRDISSKVVIRDTEYSDEFVISIDVDETVNPEDSFALGSTASTKLDITLINVSEVIFEGAEIKPFIGLEVNGEVEFVPLGVYMVDKISKIKDTIKLECFDNMIKTEKAYFSDLTYPASIHSVAEEICAKAGVALASTLPTTLINKIEGYTIREAISFIASFLGGFARFNRLGQLEFATYTDSDIDVTGDNYFKFETGEKTFSIGKLTCKVDETTTLAAGTTGNEIQLENPIMTQARLNNIYNTLKTLSYMPYTMEWQGNPALMAGDIITVTDINDNIYTTLLMEQRLTYKGGLKATASAKAKTETAQEFSSNGTLNQKMERYSIEQALIKVALIDKASINDLYVLNQRVDNLYAIDLVAINGQINNLYTNKLDAEVANIKFNEIDIALIGKATISDLTATNARLTNLEGETATINTILSKAVFSELAEFGQILAGSSIIAQGAIGSAQISDLDVVKLNAGIFDTAKFTVQGSGGRLKIENNLLQVFDGTVNLFERIALGDINGDGSKYGLRIRGADGTTILFDENGQTKEGFTDGYNKLADNSLNPAKLDIAQVVTRINNGTTTIDSSKIFMDNKTLKVAFETIETTVGDHETAISSQGASITALNSAINLKVNTSTYNTKMSSLDGSINTINSSLSTQSSAISVLQGQIVSKVTQTDIDNSINKIEVGGRNLFKDSNYATRTVGGKITLTSRGGNVQTAHYDSDIPSGLVGLSEKRVCTTKGTGGSYHDQDTFELVEGETYTLSYWAKGDALTHNSYFVCLNRTADNYYISGPTPTLTSNWKKYSRTFTVTSANAGTYRRRSIIYEVSTSWISHFKLEKGNKSTDWTPAPEDIQSQIDANETRISTAESSISQHATDISLRVLTSTYNTKMSALDNSISSLDSRLDSAELKITDNSIVATVRQSSLYISDLGSKANQSALDTTNSNLSGLTTRMSSAESAITQNATDISLRVLTTTYTSGLATKENTVYKQSTAPAHSNGRLWLDTSVTPNQLKRSTGSAWVKATPSTAGEVGAYSQADGASLASRISTAELKITPNAITTTVSENITGNTLTSIINQTATTVKLQASKINLVGAVTVLSDIVGNLGTITAGTINGAIFVSQLGNQKMLLDDGKVSFENITPVTEVDGTYWYETELNNNQLLISRIHDVTKSSKTLTLELGKIRSSSTAYTSAFSIEPNRFYLKNDNGAVFTDLEILLDNANKKVDFNTNNISFNFNKIIKSNNKEIQHHKLTESNSFAITATDNWNHYAESGFYMGLNLLNAPPGSANGWVYVTTIKHNNLWSIQYASDFHGSFFAHRARENGNWLNWVYHSTANDMRSPVSSENGYTIQQNGIIYQWGTHNVTTSSAGVVDTRITYPIAFPVACRGFYPSLRPLTDSWAGRLYHQGRGTQNVRAVVLDGSASTQYAIDWFAVGY